MKKKIKDLELEEIFDICSNHSCKKCPLKVKNKPQCKPDYPDYLEEEIEI